MRLVESGVRAGRRRLVVLGGAGALAVATAVWLWRGLHGPTVEQISGVGPFVHYLQGLVDQSALGWVLWGLQTASLRQQVRRGTPPQGL